METDLFEFWAAVPGHARQHPADATVLSRMRHNFRLDCLPNQFFGPLRSARVVFLFLSPGFLDEDVTHAGSEQGQTLHEQQRTGDEWLPSKAEHRTAWNWWNRKVGPILRPIGHNLADVRDRVAFLNISAYKSPGKFRDYRMLETLPSSHACLSWARSVLFPQAKQGEKVVVCLLAARRWGLERGERYGSSLFAPETTRNGFMYRASPLHEMVIEAIDEAISEPVS
jgi:hypothetical protein